MMMNLLATEEKTITSGLVFFLCCDLSTAPPSFRSELLLHLTKASCPFSEHFALNLLERTRKRTNQRSRLLLGQRTEQFFNS
jgi:hypothetical protein